jgi:hypothetical protein
MSVLESEPAICDRQKRHMAKGVEKIEVVANYN